MKIDEGSINHNAVRVIENIVAQPYEYGDASGDFENQRLIVIGAIRGVIDLANELKEVLKT